MRHRVRSGLVGCVACAGAISLGVSAAWAAPSITPTSGPSGTRIRAVDAGCGPFQRATVSLVSFETRDRSGQLIDSGGPPPGGGLLVDQFGTGVVSGPPGEYPIQIGCASTSVPFSSGIPVTARPLTFELTGPGPSASPAPEPAQAATTPSRGSTEPASEAEDGMGERARARAAEVQARNVERQAAIQLRRAERDETIAERTAERAGRSAERQAARAAELAERAAERAAR